jgi:xanthine dehydrogenase small subunit
VRIACGGMAAVPARARRAESALLGHPFDEATVDAAVAALALDFQPISDMRAGASYRLQGTGNLLRRFQLEANGAPKPLRTHESELTVPAG